MKKRFLSLLLTAAMCFALLPGAALAEDEVLPVVEQTEEVPSEPGEQGDMEQQTEDAAQPAEDENGESVENGGNGENGEEAGAAEPEENADEAADADVLAVQERIDALPGADELPDLDADELEAAYMDILAAYEAYDALTAEQQAQIEGEESLETLLNWFNGQIAPLDETGTDVTATPDAFDADGEFEAGTSTLNGIAYAGNTGDETFDDAQFRIVQKDEDVTIKGNLTINSTGGGLIICEGATLTVEGALIFNGNSGFGIYGQSYSNGSAVGELIIDNSNGNGAAIRTESTSGSTPQLNIYSGALTINGGNAEKLVEGVELYSANHVHMGKLNNEYVSYGQWSGKSSLDGTELVIEYCAHEDAKYTPATDGQHHIKSCEQCGFNLNVWGQQKTADCTFDDYNYHSDESMHYNACLCGNYDEQSGKEHNQDDTVLTDGNKKHSTGCSVCGYTSGEPEDHKDWDTYGACGVCGVLPIATDADGNLYEDNYGIRDAIANGVTEFTLVSYATGEAYQNTVRTSLVFDTDKDITLNMGNCALEYGNGGAALEVSGGTLTVKDDAIIENTGKSSETVGPAIVVTGGELIFENAVTATGGASSDKVASAIEVSGGTVTFNGAVTAMVGTIDTVQPSGYTLAPAINITGGTVTFTGNVEATGGYCSGNGNKAEQKPAIYATGGELHFNGNLTLDGGLELAAVNILKTPLTQGTFTARTSAQPRVKVGSGGVCLSLLADGYAFAGVGAEFKPVNGNYYTMSENVTIMKHSHTWKLVEGKTYSQCDCGKTCSHIGTYVNGECSVCRYECPHEHIDNDGKCEDCGAQMLMKIENGGTTTYSVDFAAAMNNATDGTTITLLADVDNSGKRACITGEGATVTLNLNGHTINEGWISVGMDYNQKSHTSSTLKIVGNGSFILSGIYGNLGIGYKATLDLSEWTGGTITRVNPSKSGNDESTLIVGKNAGTIENLEIYNWPTSSDYTNYVKNTKLSGGSYGRIYITMKSDKGADKEIPYSSMLAPGYAFQYTDKEGFVGYTEAATYGAGGGSISKVKVVKCQHEGMEPGEGGIATCAYCGKIGTFVANVGGNLYEKWDAAFADWLENGGTLKLYANYESTDSGDVTWSSGEKTDATIDLNGHKMSVANDGAFKPARNMSLTIKDTSEGQNGSISHILLSKTNSYQSFTLEGGNIGKLEVQGFVRVNIHGGSIDNLAVQDWHEGASLLIEGGSIGQYSLPEGKILADLLLAWTTYYCTNSDADLTANSRTETSKITFKPVPITLGSGTTTGEISFGGNIPFAPMMDTYGSTVDSYSVLWYRRTDDGVQLMETVTENGATKKLDADAFKDVKAKDELDVFCVIQVTENGSTWQTAITGYTLKVLATDLSGAEITITSTEDELVYTGSPIKVKYEVKYGETTLVEGTDYTVSGNTETDAGTYKLTITAANDSNYGGSKEATWTIKPHTLSMPPSITAKKAYDGTNTLPNGFTLAEFLSAVDGDKTMTLTQGTDFELTGNYDNENVGTGKTVEITVTLKENGNYTFADGLTYTFRSPVGEITKAAAPTSATGSVDVMNNRAYSYEFDLEKLLPKLDGEKKYGDVTYALGAVQLDSRYYNTGAKVENGILTLPIKAVEVETTGKIGTVTVAVSSANIENFDLTITVNAVNKIIPTGEPTLSKATLAYGDALSDITLSGSMKDGDKEVKGTFAWVTPDAKMNQVGNYEAEWRFTPTDGDTYAEATGKVTITVTKATPKGTPAYEKITSAGKTLKDANLTVGTIQPADGTIKWDLDDTTTVAANTAYAWTFTPKDADHYDNLTGSITLYSVSSSSGGHSGGYGGGSSSSKPSGSTTTGTTTSEDGTTTKTETKPDGTVTETVTKPDGTETVTETKPDGTVTETVSTPDGSKTTTETKPDGSSTTETTKPDGSTGLVTVDVNGKTEARAAISNDTIADAKNNGTTIELPIEVKSGKDSNSAPTVNIDLGAPTGTDVSVEIPVSNVTPGTVAILVHEDGTEEILKSSRTTDNGVQIRMDGSATVKIVDNSKDFSDTRNHWSKDSVDFVTSRGLFSGVGKDQFGVGSPMTRGMVNTVLARLAGVDTTPAPGQQWYEVGMQWAKDNGISDGTNPLGNVTREQFAALLYRFDGSPEVRGSLTFRDVNDISSYAEDAMLWAVQNGIISGVGDERVAPKANASREQVAAMMERYLKNL